MTARPNIVHISTHDRGKFFGCYGVEGVHTPAIDQLARESVVADHMFAVSPICSPSRGASMTGQYPQRNGLLGLTHQDYALNADAVHLAQHLRDADYTTTLFSFQHEAPPTEWQRLGFTDYQCPSQERFPYPFMFRPAPEVGQHFDQWLQARSDTRPFYAQIGLNESHTPFYFGGAYPDDEKGISLLPHLARDAASEAHFAHLQGALRQADAGVATILKALENAGCVDNTIVIFTTDHGVEAPRAKWTLFDPGIEIAFMIRWPDGGLSGGRRLRQVQSNVHFTPTLLDLCGIQLSSEITWDGKSQADWFRGEVEDTASSEPFFGIYHNGACRCVRTDRYKLIRSFGTEITQIEVPVSMSRAIDLGPPAHLALYDLADDPLETRNLAASPEHQTVCETLDDQLFQWLSEVDDPVLRGPEPTPYYLAASAAYAARRKN